MRFLYFSDLSHVHVVSDEFFHCKGWAITYLVGDLKRAYKELPI